VIIDPIRLFSRCQAAFIQKSDLEQKIYTLTSTILVTGIAYSASCVKASNLRRFDPYQVVMGTSIATWLFLSTIVGYYSQNLTPTKQI
jgi:hypothetical protein